MPDQSRLEEEEIKLLQEILEVLQRLEKSGSGGSGTSSSISKSVTGLLEGILPEGVSKMLPSLLDAGAEMLPELLALL